MGDSSKICSGRVKTLNHESLMLGARTFRSTFCTGRPRLVVSRFFEYRHLEGGEFSGSKTRGLNDSFDSTYVSLKRAASASLFCATISGNRPSPEGAVELLSGNLVVGRRG
eukprot:scaffold1062_cov130-Cylindrotheca_fusiformis.AAC.31